MQKSRLNQIIRNHSSFQSGRITAINDDGTYDVLVKGREYSIKNVSSPAGIRLKIDDFVNLGNIEGDNFKPQIIGHGAYFSPAETIEIEK